MFHGTRDITTLYRLSFSIYICPFHVRARRRRLYIRAHGISPRSCGCVHFRPGYVHGCVKRKHRGDPISTRHTACPWLYGIADSVSRGRSLYESPRQEFYPRPRWCPARIIGRRTPTVLLHDGSPDDDSCERTKKKVT